MGVVASDYLEISAVISRFAWSFDVKDWVLLRSCFTDEIETDYSDFRGEPPTTVKADAYVANRQTSLQSVKTQHLSTNHQIEIEGDKAVCRSSMMIHRFHPALPENESFFNTHASYIHTLQQTSQGWKISKIKQSVLWNTGNPQIHGAQRK